MKTHLPSITMAAGDHRRLMHMAERLAEQAHPLAIPLRHELRRAVVCAPDELSDDVVTLDMFVTYRLVGGDAPEKRMLIHPDDSMWPPAELSVLTPIGLSLLGLRAGDRMPVLGADGVANACVEIEAVGPKVIGAFVPRGRVPKEIMGSGGH